MSKFIGKLKSHTQLTPAPLGFGKAPAQEKPRILLAACVNTDTKDIAACVGGADAVVFSDNSIGSIISYISKLNQEVPGVIWGGWLKSPKSEKAKTASLPVDFLAFPPNTSLFETPAKMGRILEIDINIPDTQLRAIDDLPVEAVFVGSLPEKMDWQYLISLQRLDNLLTKPLLAAVSPEVTVLELQTLWSVGVDGVVVMGSEGEKLKSLRQEIDKAVFPLPRKSKKVDVVLPLMSPAKSAELDEEEEDE